MGPFEMKRESLRKINVEYGPVGDLLPVFEFTENCWNSTIFFCSFDQGGSGAIGKYHGVNIMGI